MGNKYLKMGLISLLVFMSIQMAWAEKTYKSKRWRLEFEAQEPKTIEITYPDGQKEVFWYVLYKVINNTDRDIPYTVNIKLVIDKMKEGIPTTKAPEIFYEARIPEGVNKQEYIDNLMAYYDVDLPIVKKMILEQLRLYPKLSKNEHSILSSLSENEPKSVINIMSEVGLSYEETEACLNNLVVNNLAISQEIKENPIFVKATSQKALFWINDEKVNHKVNEIEVKVGEQVAGWEVVSFDPNRVVMKKGDVVTAFCRGNTLEYLYSKTQKNFVERDERYISGMEAKGIYKGRFSSEQSNHGKQYVFQNTIIPKKSIRKGLAIFRNVSPEMDYMALVVGGLVDPIVRRNRKLYVENEVLISAYKRPGDEFHSHRDPIVPLYENWVVLKLSQVIRGKGKKDILIEPEKVALEKFEIKEETPDEKKTKPKDADSDKEWKEWLEDEGETPKSSMKTEKPSFEEEESDDKSYVELAQKFLKMGKEEMVPHCTDDFAALISEKNTKIDPKQMPKDLTMTDSSSQGNKAKVVFESKLKKNQKATVYMVKEGGDWKVDDLGMAGPTGEIKMKTFFRSFGKAMEKAFEKRGNE